MDLAPATTATDAAAAPSVPYIHTELTRGGAQLSVRWPSTEAASCAAWLRELAATALKQ